MTCAKCDKENFDKTNTCPECSPGLNIFGATPTNIISGHKSTVPSTVPHTNFFQTIRHYLVHYGDFGGKASARAMRYFILTAVLIFISMFFVRNLLYTILVCYTLFPLWMLVVAHMRIRQRHSRYVVSEQPPWRPGEIARCTDGTTTEELMATPPAPSMNLILAVKHCLVHYADFKGKASASEMWYFLLTIWVTWGIMDAVHFLLGVIVLAALGTPALAVMRRRGHGMVAKYIIQENTPPEKRHWIW